MKLLKKPCDQDVFRYIDYEESYTVKYFSDRGYPAFDCTPYIDCDSNGLAYLVANGNDDETFEIVGTIYDAEV